VASCLFAVALLSRGVLTQQPLAQRKLSSKSSSNVSVPTLDSGTISNGVYRSTAFGFTYKLPFGWVDRSKGMSEESNEDSSADSNRSKSILLLATFERPPEAPGDTINSAVVVAAEAASSYPGLRSAEQYFGPLTGLTKSKGLTVVNELYEFRVGTMQLLRADFSKPLGNLTMRQSTLVMMEKGYIVSFTFIGGSEGEVDELVERLSFGIKAATAVHK
jgi:hypothetical protein